MPRGVRKPPTDAATSDDPRERILAGAERCIARYGLRKTTMEDIASEVGMSRPGVYRYFSDRDDLLIALITAHARALRERAHKLMARQSDLPDQIVEGLLYLTEQARLDSVMRYLVDPDGSGLGERLIAARVTEALAAEFWDPFLDPAYVNNKLSRDIPRSDIYLWLTNLGLMLMRGLDETHDPNRYRSILRNFVAPAFATSSA